MQGATIKKSCCHFLPRPIVLTGLCLALPLILFSIIIQVNLELYIKGQRASHELFVHKQRVSHKPAIIYYMEFILLSWHRIDREISGCIYAHAKPKDGIITSTGGKDIYFVHCFLSDGEKYLVKMECKRR
jgi:hypothetical protein